MRIVIQPDPRRKRVQVEVEWPGAKRVALEIPEARARVEGPPGLHSLALPEFVPWTPATPHLYTLSCSADGAQTLTRAFGMREVSVQELRFTINQRPVALKGLRYAPQGIFDAASYVTRVAGGGFNWIRCTAGDEGLDALLDATDLAGLLVSVSAEHPGNRADLPQLIHRLHHHPSLLFWESADSDATLAVLREHDPTRPVVVHGAKGAGGRVFRPFHAEAEHFEPVDVATFCPVSRETESFLIYLGHPSALNLMSVRGFTPPPGEMNGELAPLLAESARICVEQLRANPRVAAYCFEDALPGTSQDGGPVLEAFAEGQAPVRAVITLARTNLVPREEVEVSVLLLNEAKLEGRGELSLQVVGPTNQTLWKKKRGVKIPKHGKEIWTGTVAASGSIGPHKFVVQLWTDQGLAGEGQAAFFVTPPVDAWRGTADVLDPGNRWRETVRRLVPQIDGVAQVILVPPLAGSIRVYPDNLFGQVLGRVREGAAAILFAPPADWAELSATLSAPVEAEIGPLLGPGRTGAALQGRLHPVFEGLPAGGPLGRPYRGVLTRWIVAGEGEDDIAPALSWGDKPRPGSSILVRKFGNGRIIVTTMRLLDRIGQDPVADRLFINLLRYAERRALPFQGIARAEMKAVEWLRQERGRVRAWRVIGPFPNSDGTGHATVYPPEAGFDPDATYKGLFRAVSWTTRHEGPAKIDELDLAVAVAPNTFAASPLAGTYYAYAELGGESRSEPTLALRHTGTAKCWMNGRRVYESAPGDPMGDPGGEYEGGVVLKQGRNTLLVKVSVIRTAPWTEVTMRHSDGANPWRWQ
jgi:hypothetical protein